MTSAAPSTTARWGVVVPVKRLERAKTRLAPYGEDERQELALAFACDVVLAATQVAEVLVVTDDARAADALIALGAQVVPDDPDAGLNPALVHGSELLRARDAGRGVATVSADLPALRPDHLRAALAAVPRGGRAFVVDRAGSGTTVLAAASGATLDPAFGPQSRLAHAESGAQELVAAPTLRCDVDTYEDLLAALALGVGPRTRAVARGLGLLTRQVTIRSWDERGGTAFESDGSVTALPPDALQDSGFRFVRAGQRVRVVLQDDVAVRIGLP